MIPRGRYNLTERLWIRRSKLVLRGAGARKTKFYIPQSEFCTRTASPQLTTSHCKGCFTGPLGAADRCAGLRGIYGPNPENQRGAYVNTGAWPGWPLRSHGVPPAKACQ